MKSHEEKMYLVFGKNGDNTKTRESDNDEYHIVPR